MELLYTLPIVFIFAVLFVAFIILIQQKYNDKD